MRRKAAVGFMFVALLSMAAGTLAIAKDTQATFRAGNLILTIGGGFSPDKLPRHAYVPVSADVFGKIKTSDGTHPSALREIAIDIDKDLRVNVKGYPACTAGKLEATNHAAALRACGQTVLGAGSAQVEIAFPEQPPIEVKSPLTVFNGGETGGKVKLLIHVFLTVPVPAAVVTEVTITRKGSGVHSVAKVPVVAGGSGSALGFKFKVGKKFTYKGKKVGFLEARCPDGVFKAGSPKTVFKNEARTPGVQPVTVLSGSLALPCTPGG